MGWGCVDLNGKYRFTNNAIFNESAKGRLGWKRQAMPEAAPHLPSTEPDPIAQPRCSDRLQRQSQLREQMQLKRDKVLQLHVPTANAVTPHLPSVDFLTDYTTLAIAENLVQDSPYIHLDALEECSILSAPLDMVFAALAHSEGLSLLHRPPSLVLNCSDAYGLAEVGASYAVGGD